MEQNKKALFQITEAAHACGLSRSTLLRMEEKGLLTPACIAAESGRRYYDNHNVARIMQIEKFKAMGLGTEEIAGYFARGGEVTDLLSVLERRQREIDRGVEELRLRAGESGENPSLKDIGYVLGVQPFDCTPFYNASLDFADKTVKNFNFLFSGAIFMLDSFVNENLFNQSI